MRRERDARGRAGRHTTWFRVTAAAGSAALLSTLGLAGTSMAATGAAASPAQAATAAADASSSCHLGHGIKHVVTLMFDNVHYFRDNPNVPSDLQLMPNLLNFFTSNGTFLSNNHTPLIAHTADDILTTFTGLYGDRHGMPISNGYQAYNDNAAKDTDPAGSFAYWTDPVFDTKSTPSAGHDTNPSMVYSSVPPATSPHAVAPDTVAPAPWVPFTRAGCDVGQVASANTVLENTAVDFPKVFGTGSPEVAQLNADTDKFKNAEVADYVGIGVHCAQGNAFCADAKGVRGNDTTSSPTAVADLLPDEPGGYNGFQALFGHRYVGPQLGAGTPSLSSHGVPVTNAAGNLTDENGNQINGGHLSTPGFPGFGPINASQSLAYMADMLEAGVPVVNGYIADIHGNEGISELSSVCPTSGPNAVTALGPGTPCYIAQANYYNKAFGTFFQRLADDGITPANTLFELSSDEGDHVAGANVGRALQPSPPTCDGVNKSCSYPADTFGELAGNITGLLATQKHNTTPFSLESDSAPEFYVTGKPGPNDPVTRTLERDVAGLTADNPYTGTNQPIANYLADPAEMAILHIVNADPARTPTFALFAKPDYFLSPGTANCTKPCVSVNPAFAYNHGDYAAEINTNYVAFAGPGVSNLGVDGTAAGDGPNSAGPDSGQTEVVNSGTTGPWADETDIRPTLIYLTGLKDDYEHDGRVITEILATPNAALAGPAVASLGACYKQLNSSVGQFGAATLHAATAGIESSTPGDAKYQSITAALTGLDRTRDVLAQHIKDRLEAAAFDNAPVNGVHGQAVACQSLITEAQTLAQQSG